MEHLECEVEKVVTAHFVRRYVLVRESPAILARRFHGVDDGVVRGLGMAVVVATVTAGCSAPSSPVSESTPTTTQRPQPATASPVETTAKTPPTRGCGGTPFRRGSPPSWTEAANPPTSLRYVLSDQENVAGFLFADPLRAGNRSDGVNNKILWVVRGPRNGSPLDVTARPLGAGSPRVEYDFPANSSPGPIYPSIVDVPSPGCWHLVLRWDDRRATLDLEYAPAS